MQPVDLLWATQECGGAEFGDKRLTPRFIKVTAGLAAQPTASIPLALQGWGETKGGYRFFDNPKVTSKKIISAHAKATVRRVRGQPHWVFVCDPWLPYEAHSDHRAIGYAVAEAALLSDLPHYAPGSAPPHGVEGVIFYFPARPTTLVARTDADAERRRAAIACHESQFQPGDAYLQRLDRQMEIDGAAAGSRLAERLHIRRRRELHIPVE